MVIWSDIESFLEKKEGHREKVAVFYNKVLFPFEFDFENNSDKLVIFLPGAFNRKLTMPKFQRTGYFKSLDFDCISFFDPSLFLTNDESFTRAWFIGTRDEHYLEYLFHLIEKIIENRNIKFENLLFFGSSAGGIPAIWLANKFSGSNVFCCNVQTNILKHYPSYIRKVQDICFEGEVSLDELKTQYSDRLDITNIDGDFNLYIIQNFSDKFHLLNHFKPYLNFLKQSKNISYQSIIYDDDSTGHNPLGREKELRIIKDILNNKEFKKNFADFVLVQELV